MSPVRHSPVPHTLGMHSLGTRFDCDCGQTHEIPVQVCHVGDDAARELARFAGDRLGATAFILSDENTRSAAGDAVHSALGDAHKSIRERHYGPEPIEATIELGDEVTRGAADADFLVAIGAGTLTDLAKYAGDKLDRPVLVYATANSMNGYTSAITALKVRGLKRTLPCRPVVGVFADPAVVSKAPARMTAAGAGDFLSKCASSTDWRASHLIHGGYFCERPREFFTGIQERLLEVVGRLPSGDETAHGVLTEALILSGLSMVVAGSSAPASGGEHLISHYLDMKSALYGTAHDLHGAQVGVGTVYCLDLWERILGLDAGDIDVARLAAVRPDRHTVEAEIDADWGPVADEVKAQWAAKRLDDGAFRSYLQRVRDLLPKLKTELQRDLLPARHVADAIEAAGGPVRPEDLDAPIGEYENALQRARYIRNRFTVLDLAADLGLT